MIHIKKTDTFSYYVCVHRWVSVHVEYNACVSQLCVCCYHTKSGFSESTVVDDCDLLVSQVQLVALLTGLQIPH